MQIFKSNVVKSTIISIYSLLLITFITVGIYVGSTILIPITFAILLAFLFSPLVSRLEQLFGRVIAVILVVIMLSIAIGVTSYVLGKELMQFTTNLSSYRANINQKINALRIFNENISQASPFTLTELKNKAPENGQPTQAPSKILLDYNQVVLNFVGFILGSFINIVLTTLLILLIMTFILIEKEDLRGRFIRLIGQERIGATTSTINDASIRVARYLRMFLLINIVYGLSVAIGLYILGIPNALLWGALSTILRFVPYIGVWIAAAIPIALSFAISVTWFLPLFTISLFVILEAITSNILEPWLYGASTGVSSTALIIAAIFWTFLWGPIGLILSTPITVCLVVLGRHVPKLEFFSILLSDEEPLTIYEEFYHRLLAANTNELMQLSDDYLKENSLTSLYDQVLIPVIRTAEIDFRKEKIDDDQIQLLYQNIEDLILDLNVRPPTNKKIEGRKDRSKFKNQMKKMILCVPAKTEGDKLAGEMLIQLLKQTHDDVFNLLSTSKIEKTLEFIDNNTIKIIIISAMSSSANTSVRQLVRMIHNRSPQSKILIGLWNDSENLNDIKKTFLSSGTDEIVTTFEEAITYVESIN